MIKDAKKAPIFGQKRAKVCKFHEMDGKINQLTPKMQV